jgi:hypothetical protein
MKIPLRTSSPLITAVRSCSERSLSRSFMYCCVALRADSKVDSPRCVRVRLTRLRSSCSVLRLTKFRLTNPSTRADIDGSVSPIASATWDREAFRLRLMNSSVRNCGTDRNCVLCFLSCSRIARMVGGTTSMTSRAHSSSVGSRRCILLRISNSSKHEVFNRVPRVFSLEKPPIEGNLRNTSRLSRRKLNTDALGLRIKGYLHLNSSL